MKRKMNVKNPKVWGTWAKGRKTNRINYKLISHYIEIINSVTFNCKLTESHI
jgi:hypothetical protein